MLDDINFHIERIKKSRDALEHRRDQLLDQIGKAFKDVSCEGGVSLREARVIDDYGTDNERAQARELDTDTHWSQVDVEELDPGGSCLSFVDPIGYRYYIPAYMCYTLLNAHGDTFGEPVVDSNVYDHLIYSLNASNRGGLDAVVYQRKRYSLFTANERTCIARFLAFDAECTIFVDDCDSLDALKNEWVRSLPHAELKHLKSIWPKAFD